MYFIKKLFHPEIYQGKYKKNHYFEGWYFKLIDQNQKHILSIIPGVSINNSGKKHAFIQVIDGIHCHTSYTSFPIEEFDFDECLFHISIGENNFSEKEISLNLETEMGLLKGKLMFHQIVPYPKKLSHPSIMGPFHFIPFMECYHSILHIHHNIKGGLELGSEFIDFTGGYGYTEKDWGKSFPKSWIWVQSNHFPQGNVSILFAIAKIPFLHTAFPGFLSFVRIGDKQYTFATYNRSKVHEIKIIENQLTVQIKNKNYKLCLLVSLSQNAGSLKAPTMGDMNRKIMESIDSQVSVTLLDHKGKTIYQGLGVNAGTEIAGDFNDLIS